MNAKANTGGRNYEEKKDGCNGSDERVDSAVRNHYLRRNSFCALVRLETEKWDGASECLFFFVPGGSF